MRDNEQGRPILLHLLQPYTALLLEFCIAHSEYLIDEQEIGINMDSYGKPQPHIHTG